MARPTAAAAIWPYPHRSIAEIDALSPAAPTQDARRHLVTGREFTPPARPAGDAFNHIGSSSPHNGGYRA